MTTPHRLARAPARRAHGLGALVLAASLAGCISIFPKEKPVQLYRFGDHPAATAPAPPAQGAPLLVRATIGGFDWAAAGDRILTVEGDKTAYVAGARWVEPAMILLDAALRTAFERSGRARLLTRGDLAAADAHLSLDVRTFEVRYAAGPNAPPVVVVRIDADLEGARIPSSHSQRLFAVETPAKTNSLGAIVEAYDGAVGEALRQIVAWTNSVRPAT
jgi:cholesterol transport system auxiliary component